MKRLLAVVVLLAGACSGDGDGQASPDVDTGKRTSATTKPATSTTSTSALRGEYALGEKVTTAAGNAVVVHGYEHPAQIPNDYVKPDPGNEFAAIDAEMCAGDKGATGVSSYEFRLVMPDDTRRTGEPNWRKPALESSDLAPNDCVRGWVTFEVPRGQRAAFALFQSSSLIKWRIA